jgi:hypothetical protein
MEQLTLWKRLGVTELALFISERKAFLAGRRDSEEN